MASSAVRSATYNVAGGYEIRIDEAGSGPAVVFIHGSGPGASGRSNFRQNIDAFVAAGFRVILPDMIGYGSSSKPEGIDYPLDLFTTTLLDALGQHGVDRGILIGNSLGGGVAIQIALDHPDFTIDRLVLMSPGCIEELPAYFAMPGIANMRSDFGSPEFDIESQRRLITSLVHDPVHVTDELVAERFAVARTQSRDVMARLRTPNLQPRLGELKMPILGFWGFNDTFMPLTGINYFLDQCDDVRFITFNKVGHWVQVERAEEFNRHTIAFLRD